MSYPTNFEMIKGDTNGELNEYTQMHMPYNMGLQYSHNQSAFLFEILTEKQFNSSLYTAYIDLHNNYYGDGNTELGFPVILTGDTTNKKYYTTNGDAGTADHAFYLPQLVSSITSGGYINLVILETTEPNNITAAKERGISKPVEFKFDILNNIDLNNIPAPTETTTGENNENTLIQKTLISTEYNNTTKTLELKSGSREKLGIQYDKSVNIITLDDVDISQGLTESNILLFVKNNVVISGVKMKTKEVTTGSNKYYVIIPDTVLQSNGIYNIYLGVSNATLSSPESTLSYDTGLPLTEEDVISNYYYKGTGTKTEILGSKPLVLSVDSSFNELNTESITPRYTY